MPLTSSEEFVAKLQKHNRVQIIMLVRWKNRLNAGEILSVHVRNPRTYKSESFYVRLGKKCRFTVPRVIVERIEAEPGDVLEVTLYPETHE